MKDKLVELITVGFSKCTKPHECYAQLDLEALADYLIAHGVTLASEKPRTNDDHIRAMLDEKMAKLLYGLGYEVHELAINLTKMPLADTQAGFLRWLKREREGGG